MAKMILKYDFIDVTNNSFPYKAGEDVSNVSDEAKKFLTENGHIEVVKKEKEDEPKAKK